MRPLAPLALVAALAAAPAALACSVMPPTPNTPEIQALFAARSVAAAASVDIAVAEGARPFADPALWRAWAARQPYGPSGRKDAERIAREGRNKVIGQRITYRVVERLKGNSPATFTLRGGGFDPRPYRPEGVNRDGPGGHYLDAAGRPLPQTIYDGKEVGLDNLVMMTSCHTPALTAQRGATYLIFRDAGGRLLGPIGFHPGGRPERTYAYALVDRSAGDAWLEAVRTAAPTPR
jgi:hypothetical protein